MTTESLFSRRAIGRGVGLVSFLTAGLLLAACSSGTSSPSASGGAPSGTLQFITSSADASDAGFRAVNEAFEKKYPDVKVEFMAIPNENWSVTSASRLTAGNVDITLAGPKELPSYVPDTAKANDARAAEAGVYLDLTDEAFMKRFTKSVLDVTEFNGKQYTVPTGVSYYTGAYYNKTMFEQYGLAVPTTWDEFVTVCETLKSNGVAPLGIGGKDGWPAGLLMNAAVQGLYPTGQDLSLIHI